MMLRKKRFFMIGVCVILCICALVIFHHIYTLKSVVWIDGDVSEIERIELFSEQYGERELTSTHDIQKLISLINASKAKKTISYAREGDLDATNAVISIYVFFYDETSQDVCYGMIWESLQKNNFPEIPNLIISKKNVALEEYLTELLNITESPYS